MIALLRVSTVAGRRVAEFVGEVFGFGFRFQFGHGLSPIRRGYATLPQNERGPMCRLWLPAVEQQAISLDQVRGCLGPRFVFVGWRPSRISADPIIVEFVVHARGLRRLEIDPGSHGRDNAA